MQCSGIFTGVRKGRGNMDTKKRMYPVLIGVLALLLLGGCASFKGMGMLSAPGTYGKSVTLQDLVKNWHAYTIYYAGLSEDTPAALLFDPKNDDKTLTGKRWERVKDKKILTSMISFIKGYAQFDPRLYSIIGPDKEVYGYVFSPTNEVYLKVLNGKTIYVYDVESPLYRNDGNDMDNDRL
jgi:hypothetical protein